MNTLEWTTLVKASGLTTASTSHMCDHSFASNRGNRHTFCVGFCSGWTTEWHDEVKEREESQTAHCSCLLTALLCRNPISSLFLPVIGEMSWTDATCWLWIRCNLNLKKIWIVCSDSPEISDLIFTKYFRAESSSYLASWGETPQVKSDTLLFGEGLPQSISQKVLSLISALMPGKKNTSF